MRVRDPGATAYDTGSPRGMGSSIHVHMCSLLAKRHLVRPAAAAIGDIPETLRRHPFEYLSPVSHTLVLGCLVTLMPKANGR